MFKRYKLLLLLVLPLLSCSFFGGCEQPEDALTPLTKTNIWLSPTKLPSNPEGTVYELWVANSTDSLPLGKFGYDFVLGRFLEPDTLYRLRADSNKFFLGYDLKDFTTIFVSIERYPDDNSNSPGAIMLMDFTNSETVKLRFPKIDSLWDASVWYNMETPSDGAPGGVSGLDPTTDGYGLWFSSYNEKTSEFNDTLGIVDWAVQIDTLLEDFCDTFVVCDTIVFEPYMFVVCDTFVGCDSVEVVMGIDSASIISKDTLLIRGLDTVSQRVVRFDLVLDTITEPPYLATLLSIQYDIFTGDLSWDEFSQGEDDKEFGLPVLTEYGWQYKAWVASPYIDPGVVTNRITLPAWKIIGSELDETDGAILSTGSFADVRNADDANPYCPSLRVPDYPGEDFLTNLPGGLDPICLVPNETGNPGRVFLSMEPMNIVSDSTNFPLILFLGEFPEAREDVIGTEPQRFVLRGWMQDLSDPSRGFPWILVSFERF